MDRTWEIDLEYLSELQADLDRRIVESSDTAIPDDVLPFKILALQIELGECANEWRGFKYWSRDQIARRDDMLEEYVDCLHFLLGIGNELGVKPKLHSRLHTVQPSWIGDIFSDLTARARDLTNEYAWHFYVEIFLDLGFYLGFDGDEIMRGYHDKNDINHERQTQGY